MRWEIRDDIIAMDTFVAARVYFDRYLRILYEAGGYAFVRQIDEIWKKYGGRNLAKKMIEAKLLKSEFFSSVMYVYLTEAALKYLKYGDSEEDFDDVAKKTLTVDTLSSTPTHKVLLASALKFTLLAPDFDTSKEIHMIGRTRYLKYIRYIAHRYAKRQYPDFEFFVPKKGYDGTLLKSDYENYPLAFDSVVNTSLGFHNSAKITILPRVEKESENNFIMKAEVYIFDTGIEKKARDYIGICLKFVDKIKFLLAKEFTIHCFSYSESRNEHIKRDFISFLKNPENIKKIKKNHNYITDVKFVLGVFRSDPLLEKIINGKVISLPKRKTIRIDTVNQEERTRKALENSRAKLVPKQVTDS